MFTYGGKTNQYFFLFFSPQYVNLSDWHVIWIYIIAVRGLKSSILIDVCSVFSFYFFLSRRGQRDSFVAIVLGKKMSNNMKRELPFPEPSFQLINNIQLDETLKDHKISLPFLPGIQASTNNLPLLKLCKTVDKKKEKWKGCWGKKVLKIEKHKEVNSFFYYYYFIYCWSLTNTGFSSHRLLKKRLKMAVGCSLSCNKMLKI